ncbi:transcription factor RelB [Rana temporaria]|uniref:transcription factor RelB n=1 Tax=Rana temporaria TaxID=8407 RepID=UPI001AAD8A86|nr:transcription factor RelB [Rana temporaria]
MREPGRTGSNCILSHDPLDDVMELISNDSVNTRPQNDMVSFPILTDHVPCGGLLDTVTINQYPAEPTVSSEWQPCQTSALPTLIIKEQPKQRGMRFRYRCEGRSAGSILGESSNDQTKTLPAIQLLNCEAIREVHISVCLVWKDPPHRIHPHALVGKDCHDGICEFILHPNEGETEHCFSNLGIQCVRKKEIESSVQARLNLGIDPYNAGMWRHHEEVDLNVVRLCFQAWYTSPAGQQMKIGPVLSEPVYDKKSTNTSELKICRMNKEYGHCEGGEEVYILCDKVQKEDIKVVFFDNSWEACANFSQADVHRQIAIVLKTPPYRDLHICNPATVQVCLQRITDGIRSDGVSFTYLPHDGDSHGVRRKRPRISSPLDEFVGHDPHGIESRRRQARPEYTDYITSPSDYGILPAIDPFNILTDPQILQDYVTHIEDTHSNLDIYAAWTTADLEEQATASHFESIQAYNDGEATASLVGHSLSLTGEQAQMYSECPYADDMRMGSC